MALDNVAVQWPRLGKYYEPVDPREFTDFVKIAETAPINAGPAAALATVIARSATVHASVYTGFVDFVLGQEGVLFASENEAEQEDPVISPDECAFLAGGLEKFVAGHGDLGEQVTFDTAAAVMERTLAASRHADRELRWLHTRMGELRDGNGNPPPWDFALLEIDVLARFYRRCADRNFAVYADF